ncbi:MAG: hypothetical protein Q8O13_09960 [Candidatus Omnitrophota bacterium]|nr:hypothetical protein [Candidatus Omnitrophota bacterium]
MKRGAFIAVIFIFASLTCIFAQSQDAAKEHFDLAVKFYLARNYDASLEELSKSLAIDKDYSQANKLLPIVLKKKDDEILNKQKSASKKEEIALANEYYNLALNKYLNNDLYGAMDELNNALKIDPEHKKAVELVSKITQRVKSLAGEEEAVTSITHLIPPNKRKDKIKAFFKNEDVNVALRTLSQLLNINIIFAEDIVGKITANFVEAVPEEVLDTILKSAGATYFIDGTVIRVVKIDEDKFMTKIFKLKHTTLSDTQISKIKEVLSDTARILYEQKSRTLMITDNYSKIHDIEEMVKKIDEARPQVRIEAKVMEVIASKVKNLGVKWEENVYAKISGATRPIVFPFQPGAYSKGSLFGQMLPSSKPPDEDEISDFPTDSSTAFKVTTADDFTFGSIESGSIQWTLEYLETDIDTTLLSNPRLLAIDDEESEIVIGTIIPIPNYERNATTGQMEITGYTDKEVGVLLKVTPKIHKDNYVTLTLHPEVSEITGYTGPNNERPIISTREVTTTLRVKDGDTVVIGGLLKDKSITTVTKLPILGDIPFLGFAFKHKSTTKEKTEVLIFLTINIPKELKTAYLE